MEPTLVRRIVDDASALADGLIERGYRVISGGTETHLLLADVTAKGATGAEAEARCDEAGIVLDRRAFLARKGIPSDSWVRPASALRPLLAN